MYVSNSCTLLEFAVTALWKYICVCNCMCVCAAGLADHWTMAGHLWEMNEWITGCPC